MREDESSQVLKMLAAMGLDKHLHFEDATDAFLEALAGVIHPEEKRRIIGEVFVKVFQKEATRLGFKDHLLGQGTIYPDTIETGGTRRADTIKTHHNRVPLIEEMIADGQVIEPLAELYKTEVRERGERLNIPREMIRRHPFPGPGLGVRVLCSDGSEDREGFDKMEPGLSEIAGRFGLQALPLPIRSVGVKADLRSYEHPVLLSGPADWSALQQATSGITAEVPGINRCIWNLGPDTPTCANPVAATLTRKRLDLLRQADQLVEQALVRHGVYDQIWQCPTVLVPLGLYDRPGELVVIRPVLSERAMTAQAAELPVGLLDELRAGILSLPGVSSLALDLTPKPPGTIEWE
jgi:GMP synthase (glutamine-hydrolysing)